MRPYGWLRKYSFWYILQETVRIWIHYYRCAIVQLTCYPIDMCCTRTCQCPQLEGLEITSMENESTKSFLEKKSYLKVKHLRGKMISIQESCDICRNLSFDTFTGKVSNWRVFYSWTIPVFLIFWDAWLDTIWTNSKENRGLSGWLVGVFYSENHFRPIKLIIKFTCFCYFIMQHDYHFNIW